MKKLGEGERVGWSSMAQRYEEMSTKILTENNNSSQKFEHQKDSEMFWADFASGTSPASVSKSGLIRNSRAFHSEPPIFSLLVTTWMISETQTKAERNNWKRGGTIKKIISVNMPEHKQTKIVKPFPAICLEHGGAFLKSCIESHGGYHRDHSICTAVGYFVCFHGWGESVGPEKKWEWWCIRATH